MKSILAIAALLVTAGCAGSNPTIDTTDETAVTFDGLYPVKGGTADAAWARPGVDLSRYSKILLQGVGIEYRPGGETGRMYRASSSGDHYEISDRQKAKLKEVMQKELREELSRSKNFTVVDKPGPGVLLIRAALLDVVSYVPPEPMGRNEIYLSKVGEATLVLEIRDSVSEAIFARAIDRRAAEEMGGGFAESNRVQNTAEVRRLARTWARTLRERLDTYGAAIEK